MDKEDEIIMNTLLNCANSARKRFYISPERCAQLESDLNILADIYNGKSSDNPKKILENLEFNNRVFKLKLCLEFGDATEQKYNILCKLEELLAQHEHFCKDWLESDITATAIDAIFIPLSRNITFTGQDESAVQAICKCMNSVDHKKARRFDEYNKVYDMDTFREYVIYDMQCYNIEDGLYDLIYRLGEEINKYDEEAFKKLIIYYDGYWDVYEKVEEAKSKLETMEDEFCEETSLEPV